MQLFLICKVQPLRKRRLTARFKSLYAIKICTVLLIATCFIFSTKGYSQKVSLSLKNAPLAKVFKLIERQTGYTFVYTDEAMALSKPVSGEIKNETLDNALKFCFLNQPLDYTFDGKLIIVKPAEKKTETADTSFTLHGIVTNEDGEPLSGATVKIKETGNGTSANEKGEFTLENVQGNFTVIISNIGYETTEIVLHGKKVISAKLKPTINSLDETLIIGYGKTTQRYNTGSVSKVSSNTINLQPVTNPLAALQGRAPGVFVSTENGLPGGNIMVQIRGRNSIGAGNEPLYIIDGVPFNNTPLNEGKADLLFANDAISPLNSINPADIKSIDILKDADATAIYGSRGANGVVLITTKTGEAGAVTVNFDASEGISNTAHYAHLLNREQYLMIRREAFKNDNVEPDEYSAPDLVLWDTSKSTDWQHYLLGGTADVTNMQLGISGGNDETTFLISGNFRHETTVLPGNEYYNKGGLHFSIGHNSTNRRLNIQLTGSYTKDKNILPVPVSSYVMLPPDFPVYNKTGELNWDLYTLNPAAAFMQQSKSETETLLSNLTITYKVWKALAVKISAGYTKMQLNQFAKKPTASLNPLYGETNSAIFGNNATSSFIAEPQLTFKKDFGRNSIDAVAGTTLQKSITEGTTIKASNYLNESLFESPSAAGHIDYIQDNFTDYRYESVFGRINYRYANKYILDASYRRDGSSRFGKGRQFGNFEAGGAGWIFSEENFIAKRLHFINYGKLRASYGITGNDQIPDYQYLSAYMPGVSYNGVTTFYPARAANPDYGWETTRKLEATLEIGLLQNKIAFTIDRYKNRSSNQLIQYPLPSQTGFTSYQYNLPALVQNTGWEFELHTLNIRRKSFSWTSDFNITVPQNKLLSFPGLSTSSFANTYVTGQSLYVRKGYQFSGIDPQTGIPQYADINKDGVISYPDDYVVIGNQVQKYYGGLNNTITFKGFEFVIFLQFVNQAGIMPATIPGFDFFSNNYADAIKRWQKPGDITNIPVATTTYGSAAWYANSELASSGAVFSKANYARIKTMSLGYTLPVSVINRWKIKYARIYIEGENLITFAHSNRIDPELLTPDGGIPVLRTFVAGVQLNF